MDRPIEVISYAGARGAERPVAIRLGPTTRRVQAVLGAWVVAGREAGTGIRRWFRVEVEGGETLSVYYDEALDGWFCRENG